MTSEKERPDPATIDGDPWCLVPRGAVAWFRCTRAIFESAFAEQLHDLFATRLPLPPALPFDLENSVEFVVGGVYATVGSDFVAICRGRFPDAPRGDAASLLEQDAPGAATSTPIDPVKVTEYAGETMYVRGELALTLLTDKTMVCGTQLGVRRVLEVVEEHRMKRYVPDWFEGMLDQAEADFQVGIDLDAQPVPAVFHADLDFLHHLRAARILGNFEAPGLNFAGSMTFSDPQSAEKAEHTVLSAQQTLEQYEVLLRTLKIGSPIVKLEAQATGKETQVVAELSGRDLVELWQQYDKIFGQSRARQWWAN